MMQVKKSDLETLLDSINDLRKTIIINPKLSVNKAFRDKLFDIFKQEIKMKEGLK